MARKRTEPPPQETKLAVPREDAARRIQERIDKGREIYQRAFNTSQVLEDAREEVIRWSKFNTDLLAGLFTTRKFADEYSTHAPFFVMNDQTLAEEIDDFRRVLSDEINILVSVLERLDLIPIAREAQTPSTPRERQHTNRAFIVHGHDEAARETVARFLERLGIEAVILNEQVTGGRTIVEKLENYSDVDFAVVLLTPDDLGAVKSDQPQLQARARQNVVLELGYFVGKLGRRNVCALYRGPLELPSDYVGVGYLALDDGGGWKIQLAKELRAAGFSVDMNVVV